MRGLDCEQSGMKREGGEFCRESNRERGAMAVEVGGGFYEGW